MRHRKNNVKFGRSKSHREALVAMLAVGLVKAKSIRTTARKAKVARSFAEKLVTAAPAPAAPRSPPRPVDKEGPPRRIGAAALGRVPSERTRGTGRRREERSRLPRAAAATRGPCP